MTLRASCGVVIGLVFVSLTACTDRSEPPPPSQSPGPATGTLTGTVVADAPFSAAMVSARQLDGNMIYTVFTAKGDYRAVHLFPGRYEISVWKPGFAADMTNVDIVAGSNTEADLTMNAVADGADQPQYAGGKFLVEQVELASYDEIYPPGPGRQLIEDSCIICHGVNYLPGGPRDEAGWNAAIDMMMNAEQAYGVEGGDSLISPDFLGPEERELVMDYLVTHFGPDRPKRAVSIDAEMPLDEAALGKAMFVEYEIPDTPAMKNRWIQEPHFDQQGNVWFTERGFPSAMTKLDPRTGEYQDFMNPNPAGSPHGVLVDPDGSVWWAGRDVHLARLDPATGEVTEYPVERPGFHGHTPVLDSNQDVWFSMLPGNRIGKWDRDADKISLYEVPTRRARPYGIVVDQQDQVWFAEFHVCRIGRFDPGTEQFMEYPAVTKACTIRRLGVDSKGIIWFGLFSAGKLGRLDPESGEVTEYDIPTTFSEPYDTWPDGEDSIWISDGGQRGALIRFDQQTETFTFYPSRLRTDMPKLAITREGAIWYSARWAARSTNTPATVGVLFPDVSKLTDLGAYY